MITVVGGPLAKYNLCQPFSKIGNRLSRVSRTCVDHRGRRVFNDCAACFAVRDQFVAYFLIAGIHPGHPRISRILFDANQLPCATAQNPNVWVVDFRRRVDSANVGCQPCRADTSRFLNDLEAKRRAFSWFPVLQRKHGLTCRAPRS
ncbi:hypothetical protein AB0E01_34470 [Nocardia vinacea]|uniref:hypothetical protein n=1 Tax=Nocardia vinacea TaxID=96468 RepID=UPI0033F8E272